MIIIHHHKDCRGAPRADGTLAGACDCTIAPRLAEARAEVGQLLAQIAQRSIDDDEDPNYLAIRLDLIAEEIQHIAKQLHWAIKQPKAHAVAAIQKIARNLPSPPARNSRRHKSG